MSVVVRNSHDIDFEEKKLFSRHFFPFFFDSKYLLTNMLQLTDVFHTKLICLWSLLNWRKKSWPEKAETERAQPFHSFTHFFPPKMKYISVRFCKCVSNLSPLSSQMLLTVLLSNKGSKINSGSFWLVWKDNSAKYYFPLCSAVAKLHHHLLIAR